MENIFCLMLAEMLYMVLMIKIDGETWNYKNLYNETVDKILYLDSCLYLK